jgi:peptidyl-prolyl cis-trans isomerase A (cyclophilin A)
MDVRAPGLAFVALLVAAGGVPPGPDRARLLNPSDPEFTRPAPAVSTIRLDTNKGNIRLELRRQWSPHGVDRFYNLVRFGYFDGARFFRIRKATWAQFGINGDPEVARAWRFQTIPDDLRVLSNVRGSLAYAFKDPDGRTTQVFINLRDNRETHDVEPFVPFARITDGLEVADSLYADYGEAAGGGIRAGKQDPLFAGGNAFLMREFPKLDYIIRGVIVSK